MEGFYGIGRLARMSGLTISALRFYDGAGVLTPAVIDPNTGYRWYSGDQVVIAQLICRLRRTRMPLPDIKQIVASRHMPERVDVLLAAHLERLEQGLADARRQLSDIHSLLNTKESPMTTTLTFTGSDFRTALAAVRFAVSTDPALPALGGVLLDTIAGTVNLVATDRYRLAVAPAPADVEGPACAAAVPAAFLDSIAATEAARVVLTIEGDTVTARAGGLTCTATVIDEVFPDYRRLMPSEDAEGVRIGGRLRHAIVNGPSLTQRRDADGIEFETVVLSTDDRGDIVISDGTEGIAVNREFILEAMDAAGEGQLHLRLDGPITPLIIHSARSTSLLMPVRL
nr:MerR family transcriptional regulator [Nocardia pseudobrasiliensis]